MEKKILFVRAFSNFTGGHLKHAHYIGHAQRHPDFSPILHVTPNSQRRALENILPPEVPRTSLPSDADINFVAGMDWDILDRSGQKTDGIPTINFVQGVRHALPSHPLYKFLNRPAIRICVSTQVAQLLADTKKVNGPILVNPNGIDLSILATHRTAAKNGRIVIAGLKDQHLAIKIAERLRTLKVPFDLLNTPLSREAYLNKIGQYSIAICLPLPAEGFYLPALEAMAMNVCVVTTDCIGSRDFCLHDETCLVLPRDASILAQSAARLLANSRETTLLKEQAFRVAKYYNIERERKNFHTILDTYF